MQTNFKPDSTLAAWRDFAIGLGLFLVSQGLGWGLLLGAQRNLLSLPVLAPIVLIAAQALFLFVILREHATLYRLGRFREVTGTVLSFGRISAARFSVLAMAVMALMFSAWTVAQIAGGVIERPHPLVGPELFDRRFLPTGGLLAVLVYFVVTAPVLEELCFRGWMQRGLARRFNPAITIVTPAWLFAALHASSYSRTVYLLIPLVFGLTLGLVAERTRSLWPSILLHALWNVAMIAIAGRNAPLFRAPQNVLDLVTVIAALGLSGIAVFRVLPREDYGTPGVASKPALERQEAA